MSIPTVPTEFLDEHLEELVDMAQTANTCLRTVEVYNCEIAKLCKLATDWKPETIVETYQIFQNVLGLVCSEIEPDNDAAQQALAAFFPPQYLAKLRKHLCHVYFGVRYAQTLYTQSVANFLTCGLLSLNSLTNKAQPTELAAMVVTVAADTRESLFNVTQMVFALVSPPLAAIVTGHLQVLSQIVSSMEKQS